MAESAREEMQEAVSFALDSPFPRVEIALEYVYA
jgi:hypothetical protein